MDYSRLRQLEQKKVLAFFERALTSYEVRGTLESATNAQLVFKDVNIKHYLLRSGSQEIKAFEASFEPRDLVSIILESSETTR